MMQKEEEELRKKRVKMKKEFDFIKLGYKPKEDLICLFRVSPAKGISMQKAANTVALESSVGTWTKVGSTKGAPPALSPTSLQILIKSQKLSPHLVCLAGEMILIFISFTR